MVNQELVEYIESAIESGYTSIQIYYKLVQSGYDPYDVAIALESVFGISPFTVRQKAKIHTKKIITGRWDNPHYIIPIILIFIVVTFALFTGVVFVSKLIGVGSSGSTNPNVVGFSDDSPHFFKFTKDCGSVENSHVIMDPEDKTKKEIDSVECFNEKLYECSAAKFSVTGQGGASYDIMNKVGENCIISGKGKTCKIPIDYIHQTFDYAKSQGAIETSFVPTTMIFIVGNPIDKETGEKIEIECV